MDRALGDFLEQSGLEQAGDVSAIHDVERVRGLLLTAARARHALSYSQILGQLGLRFSRPKMRALCRTLDAIDAEGALRDEPGLAVLVVRESDGLPGQGWWTGRTRYRGHWTGPQAARYVARLQRSAYSYWAGKRN